MNALILMTRIPYRGHTKTRLMPDLTPVDCETLHNRFLADYFACFDKLSDNINIFIAYAPEKCPKKFLKKLPGTYNHFPQEGVNIGSRMYKAFEKLFSMDYKKVVLVGCDIPHLQVRTYEKAFADLDENDMVIAPTEDGGYCLIGLTENQRSLFINDFSWGEQSVIETTTKIAKDLQLNISIMEEYRDIDEFSDLIALKDLFDSKENFDNIPERTLSFLCELLGQEVV